MRGPGERTRVRSRPGFGRAAPAGPPLLLPNTPPVGRASTGLSRPPSNSGSMHAPAAKVAQRERKLGVAAAALQHAELAQGLGSAVALRMGGRRGAGRRWEGMFRQETKGWRRGQQRPAGARSSAQRSTGTLFPCTATCCPTRHLPSLCTRLTEPPPTLMVTCGRPLSVLAQNSRAPAP